MASVVPNSSSPYDNNRKPHAVCVPYPAQGHINPMFKLAKLLHLKGFHITFVHTEYNYKRLLKSRDDYDSSSTSSSSSSYVVSSEKFQFETIPDGLPPSENSDSTQDIPSLCDSTSKNCLEPLINLISKLNNDTKVPPVTCIVSDGAMSFSVDAAEKFGLPCALLWTPSACGVLAYTHFHELVKRGLCPIKDESYLSNGYLETTIIDWIPAMKNIRLKDLPSFFRTTDPNDVMVNYIIKEIERTHKASALALNTFDALENDVLGALSSMFPNLYSVGPLHLLLDKMVMDEKSHDDPLISRTSSLWKEDANCLEWLDSREPKSVVYVNFGSITTITPQELIEFAWGLANSQKSFLWIIRLDLVIGDTAILPHEFVVETRNRGKLTGWCAQEQVLSHPAIRGFLTHCGWNSTLESICCGVPILCWPFFAEQQLNCLYSTREWGIGLEIGNNVERDEVEKMLRELMDGKKGIEMKKKAMDWENMAEEATKPGGSSYNNFEKLLSKVLLLGEATK